MNLMCACACACFYNWNVPCFDLILISLSTDITAKIFTQQIFFENISLTKCSHFHAIHGKRKKIAKE